MIYQNDSYTFALFLTRPGTTLVAITGVTALSVSTTYSYVLLSGPVPQIGNEIIITGLATVGNNGSFTIVDMGFQPDSLGLFLDGTFTVMNSGGATASESGTGVITTLPNVTTPPLIQIIRLSDSTAMLPVAASMTALDGTDQVWTYNWDIGSIPTGQYLAIVSYVADGNVFNGAPLEKLTVGDSRILGVVALDAVTAKDATVAKDNSVAKITDLAAINPNTSPVILGIKAKTDNLPSDPAGMTLLAPTTDAVNDVRDSLLGSQTVDKTQDPALLTLKRLDNSVLATYQLSDDSLETSKLKVG